MTGTLLKQDTIAGYLADVGFRRGRNGDYRRDTLTLRRCNGWAILTDPSQAKNADRPPNNARAKGPWKLANRFGTAGWTAEFPLQALESESHVKDTTPPLIQCLNWALETAGMETVSDWHARTETEFQSWTSAADLTIQSHRHVRQIALRRGDHQFVLQVPIVAEIPAELSQQRHAWLREVLRATQNQWRMVRTTEVTMESGRVALAELDLTGAPPALLESLFTVGLQSLRYAVQWSVHSADLLVDLDTTCQAWDLRQPTP